MTTVTDSPEQTNSSASSSVTVSIPPMLGENACDEISIFKRNKGAQCSHENNRALPSSEREPKTRPIVASGDEQAKGVEQDQDSPRVAAERPK